MGKNDLSNPLFKVKAHGGDIYRNSVKIDLSVSLNPLGMPKEVEEALMEGVPYWSAYPDPYCTALRDELSTHTGIEKDDFIFGNGAAELIYDLVYAVRPKKALICAPSFSEYEAALSAVDCERAVFKLSEKENFKLKPEEFAASVDNETDLVFLCNPNNPTGRCLTKDEVREIEKVCRKRQALLCVDETFVELMTDPSGYSVISDCEGNPGLCVLRAFTKTYAMAGLRLGYLISSDKDLNARIMHSRQPWNVSAPAQCAGLAAITRVPPSYLNDARTLIASERDRLTGALKDRGFTPIPGQANFILFHSSDTELYEKCLSEGILIRDCRNFDGLYPGYYRIGLRTAEEDNELLRFLVNDYSQNSPSCSAGCSGIPR